MKELSFSIKKSVKISRIALAIVLLIAAGLKSTDVVGFSREIEAVLLGLGLGEFNLPGAMYLVSAVVIIGIEFLLFSLLITGYSSRCTSISLLVLISGFTAISLLAVFSGKLDSCGCFGTLINRSPEVSLIENIILLVLSVTATLKNTPETSVSLRHITALISVWIVFSILFYVFPPSWAVLRTGMIWTTPEARPPLNVSNNLNVWVLDPDCHDCLLKVDMINRLSTGGDKLIAITDATPGKVEEFKLDFEPEFAIHRTDAVTIKQYGVPYGSLISVNNGTVTGIQRLTNIKDVDLQVQNKTGNR